MALTLGDTSNEAFEQLFRLQCCSVFRRNVLKQKLEFRTGNEKLKVYMICSLT